MKMLMAVCVAFVMLFGGAGSAVASPEKRAGNMNKIGHCFLKRKIKRSDYQKISGRDLYLYTGGSNRVVFITMNKRIKSEVCKYELWGTGAVAKLNSPRVWILKDDLKHAGVYTQNRGRWMSTLTGTKFHNYFRIPRPKHVGENENVCDRARQRAGVRFYDWDTKFYGSNVRAPGGRKYTPRSGC